MWRPKFHFALPVWGERYIDVFRRATLPCLLAPDNLGDFRWAKDSVFKIFTREIDAAALRDDRGFRRLENLIETRIVPIDELMVVRTANFARFTDCQRVAVQTADSADAALFFLGPDFVVNESAIGWAAARIVDGRSAVIIPGSRINKEEALPRLDDAGRGPDGLSLRLPGRSVVRLALETMHAQTKAWFWDSPNFDRLPPYLHFRAGDAGYVSVTYVGHPFVVRSRIKGLPIVNIWDQDWIASACPDPGEIEVPSESDDVALYGLDDAGRFDDYLVPNRATIEAVAYFAEWTFNLHHRSFARHPIHFRAEDGDPLEWSRALAQAKEVVANIDALLAEDDDLLLQKDPRRLLVRIRARYRYADRRFYNPPYAADTGEIGNNFTDDLPRLLEVASAADHDRLIALARHRGITV